MIFDQVQSLCDQIENIHTSATLLMAQLYSELRSNRHSGGVLADLGYIINRAERVLNDTRVELSAKRALIDKLISVEVIRAQASDPDADHRIVGQLASARPDVKVSAKPPDPGTPEYEELVKFFGLGDSEAIKSGLVAFSFSRLSDYLTQCAADGRNPPPGLGKTFEQVKVLYSPRKIGNGNQ